MPLAKSKLNTVVNVAILATLVIVIFQGPMGRPIRDLYKNWKIRRDVANSWQEIAGSPSRLIGRVPQPRRTIVAFIDYECTYCRKSEFRISNAVAQDDVDIVIRHLPIESIHRRARSAAMIAICSEKYDLFDRAHNYLLTRDDWIDQADWDAWTTDLGIPDPKSFYLCLQAPETSLRIENDSRIASHLGISGTPVYVTPSGVFAGDFEGARESLPKSKTLTDMKSRTKSWKTIPNSRIEIGSAIDGYFVLHDVVGLSFFRDGRIVVGNGGTSELLIFGPDGSFLQTIGGRGEGPGEFVSIGGIGVGAEGGFFAFDFMGSRVSEFDTTGELVRDYAIEDGALTPFSGLSAFSPVGFTAKGELIAFRRVRDDVGSARRGVVNASVTSTTESVRQVRREVEIHLFDDVGASRDTVDGLLESETVQFVQTQTGSETLSMVSNRLKVPFLKTLEVAFAWDILAFGNTDRYEIGIVGADGRIVGNISRDLKALPVPDGHLDQWREEWVSEIEGRDARKHRRRVLDDVAWPATLPAFESLLVQEGGRVWVEEFQFTEDEPSHWQVYNLSGVRLGEAELPLGFRPLYVGGSRIAGVWEDELGVEFIHVYDLEEPSISNTP